jgi:(p)ppGpp synthase/HD superfamily hydrolase
MLSGDVQVRLDPSGSFTGSSVAALQSAEARPDGIKPVAGYAQTSLQLFNQMRHAGYTTEDLATVRRAYDLAMRLFTSEYRGSGKPLLAHLVGTASVLVSLRARVPVVAAAVLHAAYLFGEFGDGRRRSTPAKRDILRQAVGSDIEDLITRYDELRWEPGNVPQIHARVGTMTPGERDVLLIRLANELEDHLDLGVLYCGNADGRRAAIHSWLGLCVDMAHGLGQPVLAAELKRVFDEVLSDDLPAVLRQTHKYTHRVPPASHMLKPRVAVRRFLDEHPRIGRLLHPW